MRKLVALIILSGCCHGCSGKGICELGTGEGIYLKDTGVEYIEAMYLQGMEMHRAWLYEQ